MPPRTALSTPLRAWKCPQCRAFSTSQRRWAVGPEHPRYIEVPEPPQQTSPYRPFIKGKLPVPRDIFSGAQGKDRANDEEIAKATPLPGRKVQQPRGSRDEWKQKMSAARRQNLREGLKGLRTRRTREEIRAAERSARKEEEREELINRPEREDERLTSPSHGLDVEKLLHGPLEDPTREARLAHKARNLQIHTSAKQADRLDNLHNLYMNARHFIVTPQQLDAALELEFGTPERPVTFGAEQRDGSQSVWAHGKPESVQDMLDLANGVRGGRAMGGRNAQGYGVVNVDRVRRIAEKLTGGKMDREAS